VKTLNCREHGGTFTVPPRRGRPPVRCTPDNPCTGGGTAKRSAPVPTFSSAPSVAVETGFRRSSATKTLDQMNAAELRAYARSLGMSTATKLTEAADLRRAIRKYQSKPAVIKVTKDAAGKVTGLQGPARKAPQPVSEVTTRVNASVPKAHAAKQRLEPLGWSVKGRAWFDDEKGMAEITAVREDETLVLQWADGKLVHQDYGIWDIDQPQKNNKPASRLPFDPDEVPDKELVGMLQGMTVTWWNALAQSNETATIDPQKITIEHAYTATMHGDETPADRIVKFVAMHGGGFRAFRLGALLKIGS